MEKEKGLRRKGGAKEPDAPFFRARLRTQTGLASLCLRGSPLFFLHGPTPPVPFRCHSTSASGTMRPTMSNLPPPSGLTTTISPSRATMRASAAMLS